MNLTNQERLEYCRKEFNKAVGGGQFSRYKFAVWLIENEPALSEYIIEAFLKLQDIVRETKVI